MKPSNILEIESLDTGWRDKDDVLLHACFQLLSDFVEKEMIVQDFPDWNATAEMIQARKEIEELYAWWKDWRQKDMLAGSSSFEADFKNYSIENEMLKRLVDVRMHMWT